jgi:hypothetical protein
VSQVPSSTSYDNVTTHEGNRITNGTQTYSNENCTYIQQGSISVTDEATLMMKNAKLVVKENFTLEFAIATFNATLIIENFEVTSNEAYFLDIGNDANATAREHWIR